MYCTDEATADVLSALLTTHKVHAILINERGAEQKMVEMLQRRGIVVVRLMDQVGGVRDDRQLLLLPPGTPPPGDSAAAAAAAGGASAAAVPRVQPPASADGATASSGPTASNANQDAVRSRAARHSGEAALRRPGGAVFPNVPYEERKYE